MSQPGQIRARNEGGGGEEGSKPTPRNHHPRTLDRNGFAAATTGAIPRFQPDS